MGRWGDAKRHMVLSILCVPHDPGTDRSCVSITGILQVCRPCGPLELVSVFTLVIQCDVDLPAQISNPTGQVVLGWLDTTGSYNLQIGTSRPLCPRRHIHTTLGSPLASGFPITAGKVDIVVPSYPDRTTYIVACKSPLTASSSLHAVDVKLG